MFSNLEEMLARMQASKSALSELNRVNACLANFDELTVAEFCKKIDLLSQNVKTAPKHRQVNEELVGYYVSKLADSVKNRAQMEAVISEMKANTALKNGELGRIAANYVGSTKKYAKAADVYKDIRLRLEAHLAAIRRLDAASDIF